ncbi:MAG TPA: hypothetical protein VF711_00740, partial [Acidimicrobiales bacterium]
LGTRHHLRLATARHPRLLTRHHLRLATARHPRLLTRHHLRLATARRPRPTGPTRGHHSNRRPATPVRARCHCTR